MKASRVNGVEQAAGFVRDLDRHVQKLAIVEHRIRHQFADAFHRILPGFGQAGEFLPRIVQGGLGLRIKNMEEKYGHLGE
jgi:hypothetical protein